MKLTQEQAIDILKNCGGEWSCTIHPRLATDPYNIEMVNKVSAIKIVIGGPVPSMKHPDEHHPAAVMAALATLLHGKSMDFRF